MDKASYDSKVTGLERNRSTERKLNADVMFKPTQHMFSAEIGGYFHTEVE